MLLVKKASTQHREKCFNQKNKEIQNSALLAIQCTINSQLVQEMARGKLFLKNYTNQSRKPNS